MKQPTLFSTVGLPGTGKTTAARRIEVQQRALRLTKDEWIKALYGHDNPDVERSTRLEISFEPKRPARKARGTTAA